MSIIDDIFGILKGANPGTPDEEIHTQAAQLAQHPDAEAVMKPIAANNANMISPMATPPMPASSFDVGVSDNTATQNGSMPGMDAPAESQPVPQNDPSTIPPPQAPVPPVAAAPAVSKAPVASTVHPIAPEVPKVDVTSDQATRDAGIADALKKHKMSMIPAAIAGVGDAIAGGAKAFGVNAPTDKQDKLMDRAKANFEESKGLLEEHISNDPNSAASKTARSIVLQIAPQMANDPSFATMSDKMLRDKLPLVDTMMKARAAEDSKKLALAQMKSNKDIAMGFRTEQQQDKLEQNAKQMVSNLRGDRSLARAEEQRDAAITAVNRINEVSAKGQTLNPIDYTDILGQIYKARTGGTPGEQILQDIRQPLGSAKFNKAWTFMTGQQTPATSKDIQNSLLNMATSMGSQADKFHDGYMKAHLIKPQGLEDSRWQPILTTGRGMSFAEATKAQEETPGKKSDSDPMGLR